MDFEEKVLSCSSDSRCTVASSEATRAARRFTSGGCQHVSWLFMISVTLRAGSISAAAQASLQAPEQLPGCGAVRMLRGRLKCPVGTECPVPRFLFARVTPGSSHM